MPKKDDMSSWEARYRPGGIEFGKIWMQISGEQGAEDINTLTDKLEEDLGIRHSELSREETKQLNHIEERFYDAREMYLLALIIDRVDLENFVNMREGNETLESFAIGVEIRWKDLFEFAGKSEEDAKKAARKDIEKIKETVDLMLPPRSRGPRPDAGPELG